MRRKRNPVPFKPILVVAVIVLIGIMVYNSGVLIDIGLLKGNIPEDIGIKPNDPRVIAKMDETVDRKAIKDIVDKMINLITGKEEQGSVKVVAEDSKSGKGLAGLTFELRDAITHEVLDTVVTGADGTATTIAVDYRQAYRLVQTESVDPFVVNEEEIVFEMAAPIMELHMTEAVKPYVVSYTVDDLGQATVTDMTLNLPELLQKPELPNGCEITALTSILNFYQFDVDKVTLSNDYLPKEPFFRKNGNLYGADPNKAFSGDPADPAGWFVYAGPTVQAANGYLRDQSASYEAIDLTGSSEEEIMSYVASGHPVGIWATRDLSLANYGYGWYLEADDSYFSAATNLHCMVIYGYVGDQLYVMDPLQGNMIYDKATLFASFESLGSRAMIVKELDNE